MTRRCRSSTRTGRRLATQARLRSAELPNFKLSLDLAGCEQAISRAEPFALASPARSGREPSQGWACNSLQVPTDLIENFITTHQGGGATYIVGFEVLRDPPPPPLEVF
jgi:hypothetical protein